MARSLPLDKILYEGTPVFLDKREAWIIQWLGTNATSSGRLRIDNKPVGNLIQDIAPLHWIGSNLLGPLELKDLYYVVPPETVVEWAEPPGTKARVIGVKVILEPGETLGEPYISRFKNQYDEFWGFITGSFSKGVDTAWPDEEENEVISITPRTIEKYVFDSVLMAAMSNVSGGVSEGEWAVGFYLDNIPLENIVGFNEQHYIDVLSAPYPPATTTEMEPFTFDAFPIELLGDHTLSIRVRNTSGASKSPPTGASITAKVTLTTKYYRTKA